MKLLHTSDWHIGRRLYGKKRYEEFKAFFKWLKETIEKNRIDILLVAGDIFDNSTPGNKAQKLYYNFLYELSNSQCKHIVIIAGNHDSPSFLNAPKELLKALNVHIRGSISESPEDEVLLLDNQKGDKKLIICAAPYLRDKDIRVVEAGESIELKEQKLLSGIKNHYQALADTALKKQEKEDTPIIAMGHLFTAGGQTSEGDGVRELYVGSLAHISAKTFPDCFDYMALGHLHLAQKVKGSEKIYYCGSPLPMSFGEAKQRKLVYQVEFKQRKALVNGIDIPVFQRLESVRGDLDKILSRLSELKKEDQSIWVEVSYEGDEIIGNLKEKIEDKILNSKLEVLRIRNNSLISRVLKEKKREEALDDIDRDEVFKRCLESHSIKKEEWSEFMQSYKEITRLIDEEDLNAE